MVSHPRMNDSVKNNSVKFYFPYLFTNILIALIPLVGTKPSVSVLLKLYRQFLKRKWANKENCNQNSGENSVSSRVLYNIAEIVASLLPPKGTHRTLQAQLELGILP